MRLVVPIAVLMVFASPLQALAQARTQAQETSPASVDLNQDWVALNVQLGHVQKSLAAYVAERGADRAAAAESEARLKWVLDNWVKAEGK